MTEHVDQKLEAALRQALAAVHTPGEVDPGRARIRARRGIAARVVTAGIVVVALIASAIVGIQQF